MILEVTKIRHQLRFAFQVIIHNKILRSQKIGRRKIEKLLHSGNPLDAHYRALPCKTRASCLETGGNNTPVSKRPAFCCCYIVF